jgi:hypothetical protein
VFSRRYDHQTGSETKLRPFLGGQRTSVLFQVQVLGSCCLPVGKVFPQAFRPCLALLFPDQIKPIEQLVPVS